MKILHLEKEWYPTDSLFFLESHGKVHYHNFDSGSALFAHLKYHSYEVIFTRIGLAVTKSEMDTQPALKFIVTPSTGLNHIDLIEAAIRGIQIISLKGETSFLNSITSTAEHTWMLLLSVIRNLIPAHKAVLNGSWDRRPYMANELFEKKLGIIGYGRLGKILARYGEAFNMDVLCHDIDNGAFDEESNHLKVDEDKLLEEADYVILQTDYRPEYEMFFDSAKFSKMKKEAYFINTSRGELVDETALLKALKSGQIKGAAIDVLNGDAGWGDRTKENDLIEYAKENDNLIITPHMGGFGLGSIHRTREFVTKKLISSLSNK